MRYLSDDDLRNLEPAENATLGSPIPTQVVSNGEFTPIPQTDDQKRVEQEISRLADLRHLRFRALDHIGIVSRDITYAYGRIELGSPRRP